MPRVQISSAVSGSPINFTCKMNPFVYDPSDEPQIKKFEVLHGSNIWQKKLGDYQARVMRWENLLPSDTGIMNLLTYFRSIEGQTRYINFNDIEVFNKRWLDNDTSTPWRKCRIVNTKSELRPGGRVLFDLFEVYLKPED